LRVKIRYCWVFPTLEAVILRNAIALSYFAFKLDIVTI
jgi:hypothetical protein